MVSLLLAFARPLPSTMEVMEPYCTTSVMISLSPSFLPPRTLYKIPPMTASTSRRITRRTILRRFFRGMDFHFSFSGTLAGALSTA